MSLKPLSVSAFSFEVLPLEGALAVCHWAGFKGVGLPGFVNRGRSSYDPEEIGANPQPALDHLLPMLNKYELHGVDYFVQFASGFWGRSMNEPETARRQKNIAAFPGISRFCQQAKIPVVTVLPGVEHPGRSFEQDLDTAAETLRAIVKISADAGIQLCFEPHMESLTNTPEKALKLVERVPGLKITLDYSHFVLQHIDMEQIHSLIPHTGYVHLRPARPGKLQTRFAEGTIDWVDISKRLAAANYQGDIALEFVCGPWFDNNQVDTLTESIVTRDALAPYFGG